MPTAVDPAVRFQRHFDQPEIGCWLWRGTAGGTKGNQYGYFRPGTRATDRKVVAHRFAYELWIGPIPEGREVDHVCKNTLCVRPDHLEAVTPTENQRRERLETCSHGHDLTKDENCLWDKRGRRRGCILCNREKARIRMAGLYAQRKG